MRVAIFGTGYASASDASPPTWAIVACYAAIGLGTMFGGWRIVKEGSFNLDQGVGVRAQSGEKTGFAYSNAITPEALSQAARAAESAGARGRHR